MRELVRPADDDAQFTVFRPAVVRPARWYPLLAFVHRSDPFVDPVSGHVVDPLQQVKEQAERLLRDQGARFRSTTVDNSMPLHRDAELVLQPWLVDGEVNPRQALLRWAEPVHRVDFRLRAAPRAHGRIVGGLRVFLGVVLLAEVTFSITVDAASAVRPQLEHTPVKRFRNIFASYSHADSAVVDAVATVATVIGDRYLIDALSLRAGEEWEPRLDELIDRSDIFQLFWSRNAMESVQVRREWEYALSLRREGFIRPVYWEDPPPMDPGRSLPPPEIGRLHWARLPVIDHRHFLGVAPPRGRAARPVGPGASGQGTRGEATGEGDTSTAPISAAPAAPVERRRRGRFITALVAVPGLAVGAAYVGLVALGGGGAALPDAAAPTLPAPPVTAAAPATSVAAAGPPILGAPGDQAIVAASGSSTAFVASFVVGPTPQDVAIAPDGRTGYVANGESGTVSVLDLSSGATKTTIDVLVGSANFLAISPDGEQLYVASQGSRLRGPAIAVVDLGSFHVTATIAMAGRPGRPAISPNGAELDVPVLGSPDISVVDTRDEMVIDNIRARHDVHSVVFSRDGSSVYASSPQANLVSVFSTATDALQAEVAQVSGAADLALNPRRPLLAAIDRDRNSVSLVDLSAREVVASVPVGQDPVAVAWAPDGAHAYVVNSTGNSLSVVEGSTGAVTATVGVGRSPSSVAVRSDGTLGYVTVEADGSIVALDLTR